MIILCQERSKGPAIHYFIKRGSRSMRPTFDEMNHVMIHGIFLAESKHTFTEVGFI